MRKVRITVIKTSLDAELLTKHATPKRQASFGPCGHAVGDAYVIDGTVRCPEGLCPWAWHDIESFVRIVAFGGTIDGSVPANSWIRCCTDAFRPVTFLIEPWGEAEG